MLKGKKILLIITGGIAAYKSLDLIRRLRDLGADVNCILTRGGAEFITPLAVSSLSGKQTYTDLFSLKDEVDMGHIRLSRESDLIIVAPATAETIAKIAIGRADDLATTALLASDKPVAVAPAMNAQMWLNPATQQNMEIIQSRGIHRIGPNAGDLACGETGDGRMAEVSEITAWCAQFFANQNRLNGVKILITAGPTFEKIDPVRFIGNRSSGKQGYAIAHACAMAGADVHLISGPVALRPPANCKLYPVESAADMALAAQNILPADVAICTAAVSDWAPESLAAKKIKKQPGSEKWQINLQKTPDILAQIAAPSNKRPKLVIGFAAEDENMLDNAAQKRILKNCDWILANDIGKNPSIMGGTENQVVLIDQNGADAWPMMHKNELAARLVDRIAGEMQINSAPSAIRRDGKNANSRNTDRKAS